MAVTASTRSAQLGVLVAAVLLAVVSPAAGNGGIEAGAMMVGAPTRHLLQTVQQCPVEFANQNYTGVTSVCKAANPVKEVCCKAFVEFACPFEQYLNDLSTNCNTVMFSYLNMAGQYPEQLFTTCTGGEKGLDCPMVPEPSPNSAAMDMPWRLSSLVMILLVTLVHLVR